MKRKKLIITISVICFLTLIPLFYKTIEREYVYAEQVFALENKWINEEDSYLEQFNKKLKLKNIKLLMTEDRMKEICEVEKSDCYYKNFYIYKSKDEPRISYCVLNDVGLPIVDVSLRNFTKQDDVIILGIRPGKTTTESAKKILKDKGFNSTSEQPHYFRNKDIYVILNDTKVVQDIVFGVDLGLNYIQLNSVLNEGKTVTDFDSSIKDYDCNITIPNTSVYTYKINKKFNEKADVIEFLKEHEDKGVDFNKFKYDLASFKDETGKIDWGEVEKNIRINNRLWKTSYVLFYKTEHCECNGNYINISEDGHVIDYRSSGK